MQALFPGECQALSYHAARLARTHLLSGNDETAAVNREAARITLTYDLDDAIYSKVYQNNSRPPLIKLYAKNEALYS